MNDGVWFLVLMVCIAAILTVPGLMIALWRSTWIGIALNAYSFVMAGLAFVFVPLLLIKIDTGAWETPEQPLNATIYSIMIVMLVGIFWILFQVIGITAATMIRLRRQRNTHG